MALRCDGVTIVQSPDKNHIEKLVSSKILLDPLDRVVEPHEFVEATGLTVSIAGKVIKPHRGKPFPVSKPIVTSLIDV